MAYKVPNRVKMSVSGTPNTGDFTLGSALSGYQSLGSAGLSTGDTFPYVIEDGSAWEVGLGTFNSSTPAFARTTCKGSSAGGTSKINVSSSATMFASPLADDFAKISGILTTIITSPNNGDVLTYVSADSAWENKPAAGGGGGGPGGTPPAVVQFGHVNTTGASNDITLGAAPTAGNLMVAIYFGDANPTAASGWTIQTNQSSGSWYTYLMTKIAGSSESATQTPYAGSSGNRSVGFWEISGQGSTFRCGANSTNQIGNADYGNTDFIKAKISSLFIGALCSNTPTQAFTNGFGGTIDQLDTGSSTCLPLYGHMDSKDTDIFGLSGNMSMKTAMDQIWIMITA